MATTGGNSEKLDQILAEVQEIRQRMAERQHIDDMVKEHEVFINGNGKPGAKAQLAVSNWIQGLLFAAILLDIIMSRLIR